MKKFLAALIALSILFIPVRIAAQETTFQPECSINFVEAYNTTSPKLIAAKFHIKCNLPHGYRIYSTHMGQYKRDLQVGDGPTDKDYIIYLKPSELEGDGLAIEALKW